MGVPPAFAMAMEYLARSRRTPCLLEVGGTRRCSCQPISCLSFVDADGALMVEQSYRDRACAGWLEVYGPEAIVLETCP